MKIFYIVGLEHSGTTLTDHLLSTHPKVLGLGEISSFFSPWHMKQYMNRWGEYPEATLCSCKKNWTKCEFWGDVLELCGLNSNIPMIDKYKRLFSYIRNRLGDDAIIVDSSKSLSTLKMLIDGSSELDISPYDILTIFTVKDVRGFASSIVNKHEAKRSLLSVFHAFNRWFGANKEILDYLNASNAGFSVNLYEELCRNSTEFLAGQLDRTSLPKPVNEPDISKDVSHIAMGNKDFVLRNRNQIKYDSRWYYDDKINLIYLFHGKARAFNKHIYSLIRSESAQRKAARDSGAETV